MQHKMEPSNNPSLYLTPHMSFLPELLLDAEEEVEEGVGGVATAEEMMSYLFMESTSMS